jgi:alkane 1-monooxygenase
VWSWRNRVLSGIFCSTALLLAAAMTAGTRGFVAVLIAAILGRLLNEMVNYVQHYGIVRVEGAPIQMRHSWDSCRFFSNALQYNLPHHADHHMFASKPFWQLGSFAQTPKLPHGYHIMSFIAVHQPSWRKLINPLLADWDRTLASDMERSLVRERGWTIDGSICEHPTEHRPTPRSLSNQSSAETGVPPP